MIEDLTKKLSELVTGLSGLGGSMPVVHREQEMMSLAKRLDGPLEMLQAKYPKLRLPLEEAMKIFDGHSLEDLASKGITEDRLQRIAYNALRSATYQHVSGTPLAAEPIEVLHKRFANNILNNSIRVTAERMGSPESS